MIIPSLLSEDMSSVCHSQATTIDTDMDMNMDINCVTPVLSNLKKIFIHIKVFNKDLCMQLDKDAAVTLVNSKTYVYLGSPALALESLCAVEFVLGILRHISH